MTCGIYMIVNTITTLERYIGKSINVERRVRQHGVGSRKRKHLTYEILKECTESELNNLEWEFVFRLQLELNRAIPAISPTGNKIWTNPNAVISSPKKQGASRKPLSIRCDNLFK